MAIKTKIRNSNGDLIYPITLTDAVIDSDGKTLKETLNGMSAASGGIVDDELSIESDNAVKNKTITEKFKKACFFNKDALTNVGEPSNILSNIFEKSEEFENIESGDTQSIIFGKLSKWFDVINSLAPSDDPYRHNVIYRGKDITDDYESGEFSKNVADGSFKNIYIGDYIIKSVTIDGTDYSGKWLIADLDYFINKGDSPCTTHHVVIVPDFPLTREHMNDTNTTKGGYTGSNMYKTILPKYIAAIKASFGEDHILKHRSLFTNSINPSGVNKSGVNDGCSNDWQWCDSEIELMSEIMIYGSAVWSSTGYDTGTSNNQLALFRLDTEQNSSHRIMWIWLKDIASSTQFCRVSEGGCSSKNDASGLCYVRPIFLLI